MVNLSIRRLGDLATRLATRLAPRHAALPARQAYALWADAYPPTPHNPLMHAEQAVMAPVICSTSPARALDVGTGSGRYMSLLAATGARLVVGVDFSLPMLTRASGPADQRRPRVCGDARWRPFRDASFDVVTAGLMVGDVADLTAWIVEMSRVLAPGGHLVYSDFHPTWAAQGWRRTFRTASGRAVELTYHARSIAEHMKRLEACGFEVRQMLEQGLAREDRDGGRRQSLVVAVFHAVKQRVPSCAMPPTRTPACSG
jgi:malonyl-CoA O-methyltransferase